MTTYQVIDRYGTIEEFRNGEWQRLFSLPRFADRPAEALALFREPAEDNPEPRTLRMVIVTKQIYEET